ncbi:hypothetical protein [Peribacillus acanthi]|uniref:hypothetical protein n=1 Tax=Peribacillus acanthi TaxID=2171554 RepID=UPI0013007B96|nr:hypothetical protein [Peribacillus acanthi]
MFFYEQKIMIARLKQLEVEENVRNAWRFFNITTKQKEQTAPPITTSPKVCCA